MGPGLEKSNGFDSSQLWVQSLEHIPAPKIEEGTLQMQITSLDYSSFCRSYRKSKSEACSIKRVSKSALLKADGSVKKMTPRKLKNFHVFEGLGNLELKKFLAGDILCSLQESKISKLGIQSLISKIEEAYPRTSIE